MENEPLVADFLEWIFSQPRPYTEVMEAWRTSCPRLTIWEDSLDAKFVRLDRSSRSSETAVCITERGSQFLRSQGRLSDDQRGTNRLLQ